MTRIVFLILIHFIFYQTYGQNLVGKNLTKHQWSSSPIINSINLGNYHKIELSKLSIPIDSLKKDCSIFTFSKNKLLIQAYKVENGLESFNISCSYTYKNNELTIFHSFQDSTVWKYKIKLEVNEDCISLIRKNNKKINQLLKTINRDVIVKGIHISKAYELLKIDKYNKHAIDYIVYSYARTEKEDLISVFFDDLINENKKDLTPYLSRINYHFLENSTDNKKINYLEEALSFHPKNEILKFNLAICYYNLALKENLKNKTQKSHDHAKKAMLFLEQVSSENFSNIVHLIYIHLKTFLNSNTDFKYKSSTPIPIEKLIELPKNWKKNFTINVYEKFQKNEMILKWFYEQFNALEENALSTTGEIYRFTWLRTNHNPISIRIENKNGKEGIVYWKVCDGLGGYEPGSLKINSSKKISIQNWETLKQKINTINFWKLKTQNNKEYGYDGSEWIFEGNDNNNYHVVHRWLGQEVTDLGIFLIKLTNLDINKKEMY